MDWQDVSKYKHEPEACERNKKKHLITGKKCHINESRFVGVAMVHALQLTALQPAWRKPAGVTHLLVVSLSRGKLTAGLMRGGGPSLLVV